MIEAAFVSLLLPLVSFVLLAVVGPLRRSGLPAGILSSAAAVVSFAFALGPLVRVLTTPHASQVRTIPWLLHHGHPMAEVGIRVDGISGTMLAVVALVAACVQVYSLGYMRHEPAAALGRYFTWHSLFLFSMAGMVLAPNLLHFFLGWELVGLCSYLLIGHWWAKPSAAKAAVKALWTTKFADMGFMVALMLLYAATGVFSWEERLTGPAASVVAALLFLGVMGKSAQVPLHVWLPDAMEGPTPVSALLHAATMVAAGVYLIVRAYPIFAAAPMVLTFMAWVGALTAFLAASTAVVQDDIKKILAYSTCSQLGYMVAGLGSGVMMGGYFHLTTHAFFKALLFLGAGAAIHAVGSNSIHDMGGLWRRTRWSAALFLGGALALAGIPVFSGFFSKDLILEELAHAGAWGPLALCLVSVALTAFYMTRVACIAYFGRASASSGQASGGAHGEAHEAPAVMLLPMGALGLLSLGAGWFGKRLAEPWGEEYHFALGPVGFLALGLAIAGILVGAARYGARALATPAALGSVGRFILSGPVDHFWDRAYRRVLLVISRIAGWIDRYLVDGVINLVAWGTLTTGRSLRVVQTGRAQDYVFAVLLGLVIFLAYGALRF